MPQTDDDTQPGYTPDAPPSGRERAPHDIAADRAGEYGVDDLPDPSDWLAEESARRRHLKELALSDEPWFLELDEMELPDPDEVAGPIPDGPG